MKTKKNSFHQMLGLGIVLVSLTAWLIPGTALGTTELVEIVGTMVPAEQKYSGNVYTLKTVDQSLFLHFSDFDRSGTNLTSVNDWSHLKRFGINQFRMFGDEHALAQLAELGPCDSVRINASLNYSTRLLRVRSAEPINDNVGGLSVCQ